MESQSRFRVLCFPHSMENNFLITKSWNRFWKGRGRFDDNTSHIVCEIERFIHRIAHIVNIAATIRKKMAIQLYLSSLVTFASFVSFYHI